MRYMTVVAVVPEGQEGGVVDVLSHNADIRFAGSRPGVTQDALDAGASPSDWPEMEPPTDAQLAARYAELPINAQLLLATVLDEIETNLDNSDVHTAADLAADIQRVLGRIYLGQE